MALGVVVVGFTITITINALNKQGSTESEQIAQGIKVIKALEKNDVVEVQRKIDSVKTESGISDNSTNNNQNNNSSTTKTDYKSKFESSVIAGDSRAEGIYAYGILNQSSVVAKKGRNLITAKKKGDINTIIGMYPKNIFFTYGLNDVDAYGNSETFIKLYGEILDQVKSKLPDTNIYVSSILPVTSAAANKQPLLKNIASWNEKLKTLCEEKGVTYVDASSVIEQSDYEQDGIHFGIVCMKNWLDLFIQVANL